MSGTSTARRSRGRALLGGMIVLTLTGALAAPSQADQVGDRFVAMSGDDASDCASAETACRTLAGALAKAEPGATVHIAPGTYPGTSVVRADVTVQGAGADATVLGPISIWSRSVTVSIADVAIAGGYRSGGGGIENWGSLTLRNTVVRDNSAWAGEGFQAIGAGVLNIGTLTMLDSTVRDNTAIGLGDDQRSGVGGGVHNRGTLSVTGSTISGNRANVGAGLYNTGVASLATSTVSGNQSKGDGGGIATEPWAETSLAFVTITENVGDSDGNGAGDGGGVAAAGPIVATGSILGNNRDLGGEAPDCSGLLESGGSNLLSDPTGCDLTGATATGLIGVDAELGPLTDNGGTTLSHLPLADSPAIDAGSAGCPDSDQRRVPRPQGGACDIGAVEAVAAPAAEVAYSFWDDTAAPQILEDPDRAGVELGMRFRSAVDGYVTGVRFYRGPNNTGPHTGSLWSSDGALLATGTFADDTEPGWQALTFDTPMPIEAGAIYVASYWAPAGSYSVDEGFFDQGPHRAGPLEALSSDEDGGNGVYRYGEGGLPADTYRASNYWVDVTFVPAPQEDVA